MREEPKIYYYPRMEKLVERLRDDLNSRDFVLLYAYNGTGKTRLSMAFKEAGKRKKKLRPQTTDTADTETPSPHDTLYFNAYTEDLFSWDNDLKEDKERFLEINSDSNFFTGFKDLAMEDKIFEYLQRYVDFRIDYDNWRIIFSRDGQSHIKVSRGEENIFIWCVFLAICKLAIDGENSYSWVKYIYIDDPISSLDDNNAISVASDLAKLLSEKKDKIKEEKGKIKTVISSHHTLFFNVICNELRSKANKYFLHRRKRETELQDTETTPYGNAPYEYALCPTGDTPFFHHVAMLCELKQAADSGKIYTYHFNIMRNILEKTSVFFGYNEFSVCIDKGDKDNNEKDLYSRAVNLLSHGNYSMYEPKEMVQDNKELFKNTLKAFLEKYKFNLPDIFTNKEGDK